MNQMEKKNTNKFAFWGTPTIARDTLDILSENGYYPSVIITSRDMPQGRGMQIAETPVANWAKEKNIPVLKPEKLDSDFMSQLQSFDCDLFVVVAYGKILPQEILSLPTHGTINIHYSLLPKYRGATPVEQALLDGQTKTGVTIQQMELALDTGPIIASVEVEIEKNEMREHLRSRLIEEGAKLLVLTLPNIFEGKIEKTPQDNTEASYSKKIKKEDGEIDPNGDPNINFNKYRAYENWPGIFFFQNGKRIKITKARFENEKFIIEKVIPEGKKEIDYNEFLKHIQ